MLRICPRLFCIVVLLVLSGCYSSAQMPASQLSALDGVTSEQLKDSMNTDPVKLTAEDGDSFEPVDLDMRLVLCCGHPNSQLGKEFVSIEIRDDVFVGITEQGETVEVPLSQISGFEMRYPSTVKTLVLLGSIGAVIALVVLYQEFRAATSPSG